MSFQIPRRTVLPTVLLLCATAFDSHPAAMPKIAAGLRQSKSDAKTKTKEPPRLRPGEPIEREASAGQTHSYRLKFRAGQFARVTVEQRGVDVSLKIKGPNGEQLADVNSKKSQDESESILLVAEAKGYYLLEVSASPETGEGKDAAATGAGRYRAEISEVRAATEQDRNRVSAERKMSEADPLRAANKPESLKQAAEKYQEAVTLWRGAKERRREADALGALGATFSSLNEHQKARDQHKEALAIRRELADRAGEANSLNSLGLVHNSLRENREAVGFYEQALAIRRELGDERQQASTLVNIGIALYSLRDFEKAFDRCSQGLELWRKLKDAKQEVTTMWVIANIYEGWNKRQLALEYFAKVRDARRDLKDQQGEADALFNLGAISRDVGETRKALEYFEAALPLWRALNNRGREASTLNFLGLVHGALGNKDQALDFFNQALPLSRELKNQSLEATVLNNLGGMFSSTGDKRKAAEHFQQAVALQQTANNKLGEASALTNTGGIHAQLGENERAMEYYNKALPIWRSVGRRIEEGITLNNIGETYDRLGEKQQSLDYYAQALAIIRASNARQYEAGILANIATAYSSLGEKQTAIDYYHQALAIGRDVGDLAMEAFVYHHLGFLHFELGDKQKALEYHNQALPLQLKLSDKRNQAYSLAAMGFVYRDLNEPQKALEYLTQALPMHREVENRSGQSETLEHLGIVHNDLGEREKAIENLEQSVALAQAVTDPHREAKARFELARVRMASGDLTGARTQIEETLRLVETIRSKVAGEHLRVAYFATVQRYYDLYIELLMRMNEQRRGEGFDGMALQAAERARARSLLDLLTEARADIRSGVDPALLERERTLQKLLSGKAELQVRLRSDPRAQAEADALGKEIQTLAAEYQEVRARIRVASPRYAALTQPQPLTLAEIQKQVDADTLLLVYSLGEERSFLWAVTPNSINSFSLAKRDKIEVAARKAHELLSKPRSSAPAEGEGRRLKHEPGKATEADATAVLNDLSRMLLAPAAAHLGKKRLLIVAEGALQYVPFAALPEPQSERARERESGRAGDRGTARRGDKGTSGQVKSAVRNPQPAVRNPQPATRNPQPAVRNPQSVVRNPQSATRNPQSAVRNSQTPIHNPQSASRIPLIVNHEIVSLPSASTIAVLRRELEGRRAAPKTLALLADPVFEQDDERVKTVAVPAEKQPSSAPPKVAEERLFKHLKTNSAEKSGPSRIARLPYTRQEAREISALIPESERKESLDFDASLATATASELGQYRFVHFATHGYLDSEQPELSALVLSLVDEKGARQNGFLRTHEIFNLKLPAELVTLSACETGLGKEIRGEGLVGLTRGFMYAGAARVVVSLWALNDRATAELMSRFYRKMLKDGLRPAAALRSAQVELSKSSQWQSPYFWAGFTLQGEWR